MAGQLGISINNYFLVITSKLNMGLIEGMSREIPIFSILANPVVRHGTICMVQPKFTARFQVLVRRLSLSVVRSQFTM